jgi:hypothetical protein
MSLPPAPPAAPPGRRIARWPGTVSRAAFGLTVLPLAMLLGTLLWVAPDRLHAAPPPLTAHPPGAQVRLDECLAVSVLGFTDRGGVLEPADWVTLRLDNGCAEPVRHLRVDLLLLDVVGRVYGATLWLLEEGEALWPGESKTERYAVPDPDGYVPQGWAVRLLRAERPSQRRMRQVTQPRNHTD